jgi:hypothetical protein
LNYFSVLIVTLPKFLGSTHPNLVAINPCILYESTKLTIFYNKRLFGDTMKFGLILGSVLAVTIAGSASAENLNFNFLSPSFGGNPQNGAFLFGLAQIQVTSTNREPIEAGIGGVAGAPAVGGDNIGGPTIIIPINTNQGETPVIDATGQNARTEAAVEQIN